MKTIIKFKRIIIFELLHPSGQGFTNNNDNTKLVLVTGNTYSTNNNFKVLLLLLLIVKNWPLTFSSIIHPKLKE